MLTQLSYVTTFAVIAAVMDNFLAGNDQPQTNQPNDQAGNHP